MCRYYSCNFIWKAQLKLCSTNTLICNFLVFIYHNNKYKSIYTCKLFFYLRATDLKECWTLTLRGAVISLEKSVLVFSRYLWFYWDCSDWYKAKTDHTHQAILWHTHLKHLQTEKFGQTFWLQGTSKNSHPWFKKMKENSWIIIIHGFFLHFQLLINYFNYWFTCVWTQAFRSYNYY